MPSPKHITLAYTILPLVAVVVAASASAPAALVALGVVAGGVGAVAIGLSAWNDAQRLAHAFACSAVYLAVMLFYGTAAALAVAIVAEGSDNPDLTALLATAGTAGAWLLGRTLLTIALERKRRAT